MVLIFFLVVMVVFLSFFKYWLSCFLSATPISVFQLLGMRLRKINPKNIIPYGIIASQTGHPIPWTKLESTYLQGIKLEKVVTAYLMAKDRELDLSFDDLVEAERESRLSELMRE